MPDQDLDAHVANVRAAAPRARRAAWAAWRAAFAWSWLAWRLTFRAASWRAAEFAEFAIGMVVIALLGWSVFFVALARGARGVLSDTWRALWRRA